MGFIKNWLFPNLKFLARRVTRILIVITLLWAVISILKIPWINAFRVRGSRLIANEERKDILHRRAYLIHRYFAGTLDPRNMPPIIGEFFQGEWALGTCSMTAAALVNIAFIYPETRQESLSVLDGLARLVLTERFREFDTSAWKEDALSSLDGPNGHIAYLGHVNLILLSRRYLGGSDEFDPLIINISNAFIRRIAERPFPYLETYPGQIYTSDNMVVYATIKLFDRILQHDHGETFSRWADFTKRELLDPNTGLVTFWVGGKGNRLGISRGSGVGWNSFYLPFFDQEFASSQYAKAVKELGANFPFGLKGFRECARNVSGVWDIDSGPVIFGVSAAGTGFIIAGARLTGDAEFLDGLLLTSEYFGSTIDINGRRRYLLSPLVGDAIVLAMKTATPWDSRFKLGKASR